MVRVFRSVAAFGMVLAATLSPPPAVLAGATTHFPSSEIAPPEEPAHATWVETIEETSAPLADELELALFELTNVDRTNSGLPTLEFDYEMLEVARARAMAQIPEATLSHFDSGGRVVFVDIIDSLGVAYQLIGENLARVDPPVDTAALRAESALMESLSHRTNILESNFQALAVGVITDDEGQVIFAQIFRSP